MEWFWIPVVIVALVIGKFLWLRDEEREREKISEGVRKELEKVRNQIIEEIKKSH
jgi:Ni,Fe-hydrogenase maturation factor